MSAMRAAGQRLGRPDVVAALTDPPVIGLAAYLAARRYRAPLVFCVKDGLGNVRFLAYQPRDALAHSFATAAVFVVSLRPGFAGYIVPSKVYGILAAGRP